ncbi:hypothetical protein E2562_030206 [Oryza meyeriana var. granulata]|uniref:Disease resistance N-terminal domain-containing protein n=1 Tax=Oryza meyeriana var. granulata TaxID=110450 RepID=A0A6G1D906_9ORYZ|nr:hypothetical protein E2562_030206 [Oryza meyeriana var. granulata]
MAEALVIAVLQKISSALAEEGSKILASQLKKQAPDLLEVTNKMRLLQSDFSMMQAFISQVAADRYNDMVLEAWLEQIRLAAHEAEDIVDEYIYLVGQMEGTDSFLKKAFNQATEVKKWHRDRYALDLADLKPLSHLEKLTISGRLHKGAIPPIFGSFTKLRSLRLCFSRFHEDPLATFAVMFQNLGHLNLYRCYGGKKLTFHTGWFPKLKHLYLSSMDELKEVEVEDGTMRNLHRLELWSLKSLTSVSQGLVYLRSLQQLCIGSSMPKEFHTMLEGTDRWIVQHIPYIGDP